jgi:hypothetical protein
VGPWIEDITNELVREQVRLALPGPQAGPLALPDYSPASPETQLISAQINEPPESGGDMDVDEPPVAAAAPPAAAPPPITRGRIRLRADEREELMRAMENRGEATGSDEDSSNAAVFRSSNGNVLRFHQGTQIYLRLEYPGRRHGSKIMTLDATQMGPDDIDIRSDIYERAKKLGPTTDKELAAIRDLVLASRQLGESTPGLPIPPTPAPRVAPATPGRTMPGTPPSWPRPVRPPGAASGSGASGSGAPGSNRPRFL